MFIFIIILCTALLANADCDNIYLKQYCFNDILITDNNCLCNSSSTKILNSDYTYVCTENIVTCNSTNLLFCCNDGYYSISDSICVPYLTLVLNNFNCSDSGVIDTYFNSYNGSVCASIGNSYFTYASQCLANNSGYFTLYYGDCCPDGYIRNFTTNECQCQTWIDTTFNNSLFSQNLCKVNQAPFSQCSYYTCNNLCKHDSEVIPVAGFRGYQCHCNKNVNDCNNCKQLSKDCLQQENCKQQSLEKCKSLDCDPNCYTDGYNYLTIFGKNCDCNVSKLFDGYCPYTNCTAAEVATSPAPPPILCLGYEAHMCDSIQIPITVSCSGNEQWIYLSSNGTFISYSTQQFNFYPCNIDIYNSYSVLGIEFGQKCTKCNRYIGRLPEGVYCRNAILDGSCIASFYSTCGSCEYPYNVNDSRICCSLPNNNFHFISSETNTKDPNGICCSDDVVDNFGYCCLDPNFLIDGYCCNSNNNYTVCAVNSTGNQTDESYCVMVYNNNTFVNNGTCVGIQCNTSYTLTDGLCCAGDLPNVNNSLCCNDVDCCPSNNDIFYNFLYSNNTCCPYLTEWVDVGSNSCCSSVGQNISTSPPITCCRELQHNADPGDTNICCDNAPFNTLVDGCCYPNNINSNGICCPNSPRNSYYDPGIGTCCSAGSTYGNEVCCYDGTFYNTTLGMCCNISNTVDCCVPGTSQCNQTDPNICPSEYYNNGEGCCPYSSSGQNQNCCPYGQYYIFNFPIIFGCVNGTYSNPNGTTATYYCQSPSYPIYNISISGPSCSTTYLFMNDIYCPDDTYVNCNGVCCKSENCTGTVCCTDTQTIISGQCCDNIRVAGDICCPDNQTSISEQCCDNSQVAGDTCCTNSQTVISGQCCNNTQVAGDTCCTNSQTVIQGSCCNNNQVVDGNNCCSDGSLSTMGNTICCPIANIATLGTGVADVGTCCTVEYVAGYGYLIAAANPKNSSQVICCYPNDGEENSYQNCGDNTCCNTENGYTCSDNTCQPLG